MNCSSNLNRYSNISCKLGKQIDNLKRLMHMIIAGRILYLVYISLWYNSIKTLMSTISVNLQCLLLTTRIHYKFRLQVNLCNHHRMKNPHYTFHTLSKNEIRHVFQWILYLLMQFICMIYLRKSQTYAISVSFGYIELTLLTLLLL